MAPAGGRPLINSVFDLDALGLTIRHLAAGACLPCANGQAVPGPR